jgi:flavin reductase (DIM6/NTAB) family NADH-FMN oxidoreductase RutF
LGFEPIRVRFSPDGDAENGCLILTDALAYLECTIQDQVVAGRPLVMV